MNNYYVYRYVHPKYPWLYVGKTKNLDSRIRQHDFGKTDNIDRKYKDLLLESSIYYLELENSTQMTFTELYLIDKYNPYLNKKDKHDEKSKIKLSIPKWKKYVRSYELKEVENKYNKKLSEIKNQIEIFDKELRNLKSKLHINENLISQLRDNNDFMEKYIEFSCNQPKQMEQINYEIDIDEIKEIFNEFHDYNGTFRIDTFNCCGNSESIIIDKDGVWQVIDFNYKSKKLLANWDEHAKDRTNLNFSICATRFISAVNRYTCSSITPFVLLKQINENKIAILEQEKDNAFSEEKYGYAELKNREINEHKEKLIRYKNVIQTHLSL